MAITELNGPWISRKPFVREDMYQGTSLEAAEKVVTGDVSGYGFILAAKLLK